MFCTNQRDNFKLTYKNSGAGSDATGIAISVWMNSMLRHKTAYEKLTTEIRTSFESESQISWATVKDLPYLGACMNEAMRFHPPVSFPLMRWTPPEGCNIDGHWVPGDVSQITLLGYPYGLL